MIHRVVYFDRAGRGALCDLSFTAEVPSEPLQLTNTFRALLQFSEETAKERLVEARFVRNQTPYTIYVFPRPDSALVFLAITSDAEGDPGFPGRLQDAADEVFALASLENGAGQLDGAICDILKRTFSAGPPSPGQGSASLREGAEEGGESAAE